MCRTRLAFPDRLAHPVHRFMCRPPRPVPVRPRLEVGLEDRLQDELQRTLDHAVADGRYPEHADFLAAVLRDLLPPVGHGNVPTRDQIVPDLPDEDVHSPFLDGREAHPVHSRGSVVLLGQAVGFAQRLFLADMDEKAPETPRRFRLRLGVDPSSEVLQTDGRRCHPPLPSFPRRSTYSRAPLLHGHYPASALVWAPPTPSRLRPPPWGRCAAYLGPPISRRGEEGLAS